MTTTEQAETPTSADQVIGRNVHMIIWSRGLSQRSLAAQLSISDSVLSKRLRGASAWSAQDVADVAAFLDVEPGRLFAQPSLPKVAPNLSVVQGEGRKSSRHSMHNRPLLTTVPMRD